MERKADRKNTVDNNNNRIDKNEYGGAETHQQNVEDDE